MCKGGIIFPLFIYMCWGSVLPLSMSMFMLVFFWRGALLRLSKSMCMYWGVNVVSEHVDVYVIRGGQCCLCSFPCVCVCVRERVSMLPLFISMCKGRGVNVASVHLHVIC
jgi:hypothetical protein